MGPGGSNAPLVALMRGLVGSDSVWESLSGSSDFLPMEMGGTLTQQRRSEALRAVGGSRELTLLAACVVTEPHRVAVCSTPRGYGTSFRWRLLVGGQASIELTNQVSSYEAPVIT